MFKTKNVGTFDRILRALPIIIIAALYFTGNLQLSWAIGLGIFSLMLLATSLMGVCSIYSMFGFSTCSTSGKPNA